MYIELYILYFYPVFYINILPFDNMDVFLYSGTICESPR